MQMNRLMLIQEANAFFPSVAMFKMTLNLKLR